MWTAATQRLRALPGLLRVLLCAVMLFIRDRCCCRYYDNQWMREDAVEQCCDIIGGCCRFDGVAVGAVG